MTSSKSQQIKFIYIYETFRKCSVSVTLYCIFSYEYFLKVRQLTVRKQPSSNVNFLLKGPGEDANLLLCGTNNRLQTMKYAQARWEELNKAAKIQQHCKLFQTILTITYTGCPLHKHQCDFVDCWDSVCCNWHKLPQASNHKKLTLAKAHFTLHCCSTVLN